MNNESRAESRVWGWVIGLVALIGVGLRVRALFANRSLFLDEAMLALNICGRSFAGLLAPLDLDQGAPIGFLMLERLAVVVFGPTELALRLMPFLASIAALPLAYRFCRANIGITAAAIALALVAVSPALISYSGEAKQYGIDVSLGLLVLNLAADALRIGLSGRRALILGAAGALVVWFSHPVIFVLAGAGLTLMLDGVMKRRLAPVLLTAAISAFWLTSFATTYLLSLKHLNASTSLNAMWEVGFLSFPPRSLTDLRQYVVVILGVFEAPYLNAQVAESLAGRMGLIALAAFGAGILVLMRRDDPRLAALLMGPLAFALLAAVLHRYPLRYRLALFATGPILLASASGLALLIRSEDQLARALGRVLLVCLVMLPAMQAAKFLAEPRPFYGARTVLEHVAHEWQAGDLLLVDGCSGPPFRWYQKYGHVPGLDRIEPTDWRTALSDPVKLAPSLPELQGRPRVWLIISDLSRNDRDVQLNTLTLDQWGKQLDSVAAEGYYAQLYDFSSTRISLTGSSSATRE